METVKKSSVSKLTPDSTVPVIEYKGITYLAPSDWTLLQVAEFLLIRYSGDIEPGTLCIGGPKNGIWMDYNTLTLLIPKASGVFEYTRQTIRLGPIEFVVYVATDIDPLEVILA